MILPGCFDSVMEVFSSCNHHVVLVDIAAMRWTESRDILSSTFDLLVVSTQLEMITQGLIETQKWKLCDKPIREKYRPKNNSPWHDCWLATTSPEDLGLFGMRWLHLVTEELYMMDVETSVASGSIVPDAHARIPVVVGQDEEYHRDKDHRFGARRLSKQPGGYHSVLSNRRAHSPSMEHIPIYVPCIAYHINALVDQIRYQRETGLRLGTLPHHSIRGYVDGLYLDWNETTEWFLAEKTEERNKKWLSEYLKKYKRKPQPYLIDGEIVEMLPWDLPIWREKHKL